MKPTRPLSKGFGLSLLYGLCHQKTMLWAIAARDTMSITRGMAVTSGAVRNADIKLPFSMGRLDRPTIFFYTKSYQIQVIDME